MNTIVEQMKSLGLTEYEVKAYLGLIEEFPQNGYTLSKNSKIPRSRIYEVLESLKRKQIVFEKQDDKNNIYIPLEPKLLLEKAKTNFEKVIKDVDDYTMNLFLAKEKDLEPRVLRGREEIILVIQMLIRQASKRIALSIWGEELDELRDLLDKKVEEGIRLRGVYFGEESPYKELIKHRRMERYIAEKEERYIIVVIDNKHVIYGIISRAESATNTWSKDPGIIDISEDYIAHDVMLNKFSENLKGNEKNHFESTLDEMRKEYYGYSEEEYNTFPLPKTK